MKTFTPGELLKITILSMGSVNIKIKIVFVRYLDVCDANGNDCIINDNEIDISANSKVFA